MPYEKCPNCGSIHMIKTDSGLQCANCYTFFYDPNVKKHINENRSRKEITYTDVAQIEKIRYKKQKDRAETIKEIIAFLFLVGSLAVIWFYLSSSFVNEIKAPTKRSSDYRGKNVDIVYNIFSDAGFKDIELTPLADLDSPDDQKNNLVESVTISGDDDWRTGFLLKDIKTYNDKDIIRIYYHSPKMNTDSSL